MRSAVSERITDLAREATGKPYLNIPDLESMHLGNVYIRRELLTDVYVADGEASFGPTKTAWGLLEFTAAQDQQLLEAWKRYARRDGMAITAVISSLVVAGLGVVLGLLKLDTWTRGYYTKRLFLGVPAAIIALVALLAATIG
jgi:hypothetical protein